MSVIDYPLELHSVHSFTWIYRQIVASWSLRVCSRRSNSAYVTRTQRKLDAPFLHGVYTVSVGYPC